MFILKAMYKYYDKTVNKITGSLANIALDKFIKSEYVTSGFCSCCGQYLR